MTPLPPDYGFWRQKIETLLQYVYTHINLPKYLFSRRVFITRILKYYVHALLFLDEHAHNTQDDSLTHWQNNYELRLSPYGFCI